MKVDLLGLLSNAGGALPRKHSHYDFALQELGENLKKLHAQKDGPDAQATLQEFFNLYVIRE